MRTRHLRLRRSQRPPKTTNSTRRPTPGSRSQVGTCRHLFPHTSCTAFQSPLPPPERPFHEIICAENGEAQMLRGVIVILVLLAQPFLFARPGGQQSPARASAAVSLDAPSTTMRPLCCRAWRSRSTQKAHVR